MRSVTYHLICNVDRPALSVISFGKHGVVTGDLETLKRYYHGVRDAIRRRLFVSPGTSSPIYDRAANVGKSILSPSTDIRQMLPRRITFELTRLRKRARRHCSRSYAAMGWVSLRVQ